MTAVILTIHSLIVIALIGVVLLQRSDGGALGLGGGGGGGGFMTGRGAANALTRTTAILAALFFATSIFLAIRAGGGEDTDSVLDALTGNDSAEEAQPAPANGELSTEDLLNSLGAEDDAGEAQTTEDLLNEEGVETPPESAGDEPAESGDSEEETPNN